jgi:glucose/arabinose dehydrogenase
VTRERAEVKQSRNWKLAGLVAVAAAFAASFAHAARQPYVPQASTCDGYPRLDIGMSEGLCAGLVMAPNDGAFGKRLVRTPRALLQLDDAQRWLVTDLGGWTAARGKIWVMEVASAREVRLRALVSNLTLPHTLVLGPDGRIYVAEMNRIFRLNAVDGTTETVVDGLPGNKLHIGRHPISHFAFDRNGDLLVNVGADTDQCTDAKGVAKSPRCPESEGDDARAVIRRYRHLGNGAWDSRHSVIARGLRNSMVLIRHASGTLLQGENSYDFAPAADRPYDEINVIRDGANFGWPYCYDADRRTPAWAMAKAALNCASSEHEKPVSMLPPHAAPLGAAYYSGEMFPALAGKLLMSLHGYRPGGSRIVAFDVDEKGIPVPARRPRFAEYAAGQKVVLKAYESGPAAEPRILTPGWDLKAGVRPAGAPVGLTIARDGAIWVADDRNAAILRIAVDRP